MRAWTSWAVGRSAGWRVSMRSATRRMGPTPRRGDDASDRTFLPASRASPAIHVSTWPRFLWKERSSTAPPRPGVLCLADRCAANARACRFSSRPASSRMMHPSEKTSAACGFSCGLGACIMASGVVWSPAVPVPREMLNGVFSGDVEREGSVGRREDEEVVPAELEKLGEQEENVVADDEVAVVVVAVVAPGLDG